jgi:hypothetical protein
VRLFEWKRCENEGFQGPELGKPLHQHVICACLPAVTHMAWLGCDTPWCLFAVSRVQNASPKAPPTIISIWLVIVNPITKLALTLAPVAMALEVREGLAALHECGGYAARVWRLC